jgi:hypothetical protein
MMMITLVKQPSNHPKGFYIQVEDHWQLEQQEQGQEEVQQEGQKQEQEQEVAKEMISHYHIFLLLTYLRSRHQWWQSSILGSKIHEWDWSSLSRWSDRWRDVRCRIPNRNFRSRNHGNRSRRVKNRRLPNYDVSLR